MGNGRNQFPLLFANLEHLHHEWDGIILLEPLSNSLLHHRRRERAKRFPPLDLGVERGLHVGAAGVTEDRAVTERTRSPFHASLKPTDDLSLATASAVRRHSAASSP